MPYDFTQNIRNTDSDHGFIPHGTKSLPASMLTYHQWGPLTFTFVYFIGNAQDISHRNLFKNNMLNIGTTSPKDQLANRLLIRSPLLPVAPLPGRTKVSSKFEHVSTPRNCKTSGWNPSCTGAPVGSDTHNAGHCQKSWWVSMSSYRCDPPIVF